MTGLDRALRISHVAEEPDFAARRHEDLADDYQHRRGQPCNSQEDDLSRADAIDSANAAARRPEARG